MNGEISSLFVRIGADVDGATKGFKQVKDDLNSTQTAMSKFSDFGATAFKAVAVAGAAIGAGIIAGVGSALSAASEMESGVAAIGASMQLAAEDTQKLQDYIMQLGLSEDLVVDAQGAAEAIGQLGTAGLTLTQIMDGAAEATILMSNATGGSMSDSAALLTDIMGQFNIEATDTDRILNQVVGVVNATKFSFGDVAGAFAQAGGVAGAVGVTFEDFAADIALTSSNFASGSDAATSWKTYAQKLVPTTKEATDMMISLGLATADGTSKFFDASGAIKSSEERAALLAQAFGGLSDAQKIEAASTIFGTDAMRTALAIAEGATAGIVDMKTVIGDTSAEDMARMRMDTLSGSWGIFTGVVDTLKLGIGEKFLPVARKVVDWATDLAKKYGPDVIEWAGKLATVIETGVDWLTEAASTGQIFNDKFAAMPQPIQDTINVVVGFTDKIKIVTDALSSLGNRFGPLVTAITNFGGDALREIGAWATGTDTDFTAVNKIVDAAKEVFNGLWDDFAKRFPETAEVVNEAWIAVSDATKTAWSYVTDKSTALVDAITTFGVDSLKEIVAWATGNETEFAATKKIWEEFASTTLVVSNDILANLTPVGDYLEVNFPRSAAASTYALDQLAQAWRDLTGQTKTSLDETEKNTGGFMSRLATVVDTGLAIAMTRIGTFASNLGLAFKAIKLASEGDWDGMWKSIQQIQVNSDAQVLREATLMGDGIKSLMETAGNNTVEGFSRGIDKALPRVRTKLDDFANEVGGPQGRFHTLLEFGSPSKLFERFGGWTVEGFANGISAAGQLATNAMGLIYDSVTGQATRMTQSIISAADQGRAAWEAARIAIINTPPPTFQAPTAGTSAGSAGGGIATTIPATMSAYAAEMLKFNESLTRSSLIKEVGLTAGNDALTDFYRFAQQAGQALNAPGGAGISSAASSAVGLLQSNAGEQQTSAVLGALQAILAELRLKGLGTTFNINEAPADSTDNRVELTQLVSYLSALYA